MTEMVYGTVPVRSGDAVLPRWWRTIDKWTMSCILILFGIGLLLGLAASPPLAAKNGFAPFHYVERQIIFGFMAMITMFVVSMMQPMWCAAWRFLDLWLHLLRLRLCLFLERTLEKVLCAGILLGLRLCSRPSF